MALTALDLFAGHGWGVAAQRLGIHELGVEIMPEAVATRDAAGMTTIFRDVWDGLLGKATVPAYDLLVGSPPCQTFSIGGKGRGRAALDDVLEAIYLGDHTDPERLHSLTETTDPRTALVLVPLAYVHRDRPAYVVLEQVPSVLPVWEACADVMRDLGYSVVTGVLRTEQFGVPQTRKRAILIARRDGVEAVLPEPTHSRFNPRDPGELEIGVEAWVSMADALGWGMTERPYPAIAVGTDAGGGTDPAALGGSGARKGVYAERARGAWKPKGEPDADAGILRLTASEAGVLQTYPADFPFQGRRGRQFQQVGNAVPVLLAEAILRTLVTPA